MVVFKIDIGNRIALYDECDPPIAGHGDAIVAFAVALLRM